MIIRSFEPRDAEACSKIRSECYSKILSLVYSQDDVKNYIELFTPEKVIEHSKNNSIFVAEKNNKVVGFISLNIDKDVMIKLLFVSIDKQNEGIGSKLYSYSEKWLINNHKNVKRIYTNSNIYKPTIKFYKKMGFINKGKVMHIDRGAKLECVLVEKMLPI